MEKLSYDKNGNIQTLERNGGITTMVNPIDDLVYTYDPDKKNQLLKVEDHTTSPQGFNDGANTTNEYGYDANGNMTRDDNKGITKIAYNHLNLPTEILFGTNKIEYLYNATGQKVVKKVTENSAVTTTTYLGGGFQYENSVLQFFPHAEGYVKHHLGSYSYVFNYTDHLGNIRLSYSDIDGNGVLGDEYVQECFTQTGRDGSPQTFCNDYFISPILEESHYYPFGLKHQGYNTDNAQPSYKYKYNGKELQDELGLNMYDYGFRNYDPALGRWMNMDNLAEKFITYSPYHYAGNNPVLNLDIDGNQFTSAMQIWIERLRNKIISMHQENIEAIIEIQNKIESGKFGLFQNEKSLKNKIENLIKKNEELNMVNDEITELENSNQVYDLVYSSSGTQRDLATGASTTTNETKFNFRNGNVEIHVSAGTSIGLFAHELKHAYQFEKGQFSIGKKIEGVDYSYLFYDKQDEIEAYNRGALFGQSFNGTLNEVYDKLPRGPYDFRNIPLISNNKNNTLQLQIIARDYIQTFRVNGQTYYFGQKRVINE
ncbi:RHS repeat domain-containing protein [Flavobacterium sp. J27]|uniref:RHS repeat domain-containing protein n=1 Tax=Flavobacterium sp. J27 TaxID=2060419 RepID=UPI0010310183|nr:RHS repeat-associated core domain-containing protein [Flavobacterium sp. J27]